LGQDLPYLLSFTPSVVSTSDAGAGIGYTGFRVRGSDPTRINVTINGIPLNDSESHGVFWVNMPDFASSIENIQIQRGVGTSTNGAAAFGASINLQTIGLNTKAYAITNNSIGSSNTK
jgi:iron complex outermembrane receptor protein